jgi:5-methyltetrahydropteroyltriglutamate--homocysteine methyltransferase
MKRSVDRILTTHTGSLPRPPDLREMLKSRETQEPLDEKIFLARAREAVAECVANQVACGIDIVSDGELGKSNFVMYVADRLRGMEGWDDALYVNHDPDFPGYEEWYAARGTAYFSPRGRPSCIGPLGWKDADAVRRDIADLRAAVAAAGVEEAFIPSASVGTIAQMVVNGYYPSYEEYVAAIADVMRVEYRAIVDGGFILQVDAPGIAGQRGWPEFRDRPLDEFKKTARLWVDALNHALRGIPEDRVRLHVCWGNAEAPHTRDVPLRDVVDLVLAVNAGAYSVEAANPRHAHEWAVWRDVKLPDGKVLIPGVIDNTTNFVEHPELVAERIVRFAECVGRENVIAGVDCGFGTSAHSERIYPPVVWGKLRTLAGGARLASKVLWPERTVVIA